MKPCLLARVRKGRSGQWRLFATAALIAFVLLPNSLHAGAWTQAKGHGQVIFTSSLFRTGTAFNEAGAPIPFSDAGRFRQLTFNPYLEYGLTSRNTLIVNAYAPLLNFSNRFASQSSAGLGDLEVGLERRLNSPESRWACSVQLTVLFPAYSEEHSPAPGNHNVDLESRILVGRGLALARRHVFYDLELAYRYRNGAPADQVRADASTGIDATRWLTLMGQFFAIKGLRNGEPLTVRSNPNAQSDFDLYKYQPSLVFKLGRGTRVQFGWNSNFSGRNTGTGHTALLAVWKSFQAKP